MKKTLLVLSALAIGFSAAAKLPAPSEEAKAKAAEAAAKTAHGNKVADFQLCKSREKVAAHYYKTNGKGKAAPAATPACVDPGAYKPAETTAAAPAAAPAGAKPAAAPAKKG
ncbi:hypothetical protein [Limnohabitans sp. 2KL-51]|jgi:hypothetical protein|uniref:hypothetical protein n=1 Tax=Limnohabitans sp. 2KL-51 TaxID=1977911 RepID=UPI000D3A1FB4|nr:hypothetical protein [Limnohabitans sp. 2KL-51]PUE52489.1 hypothetical protein B9Z49_01335 [Limnohabitans sp. 2KL-51]